MIKINEPKVLSQTQTFKFASARIERGGAGMIATVTFNVYGDDEQHIGQDIIVYEGADFNAFWAGFTSGKFLYEQLVEKKSLVVKVPDSVEDEFKGVEDEFNGVESNG